jgi:hypothetical protein
MACTACQLQAGSFPMGWPTLGSCDSRGFGNQVDVIERFAIITTWFLVSAAQERPYVM